MTTTEILRLRQPLLHGFLNHPGAGVPHCLEGGKSADEVRRDKEEDFK